MKEIRKKYRLAMELLDELELDPFVNYSVGELLDMKKALESVDRIPF